MYLKTEVQLIQINFITAVLEFFIRPQKIWQIKQYRSEIDSGM